jgi:hypothetical protein
MKKRRIDSWMGMLSVLAAGIAMVGTFFLAGGFGSGPNSVALASGRSHAPTHIVTLSVANCAGPTLQGSLGVSGPFTGQMTVGLFFLGKTSLRLTRQFIDSGLRASANFDGGTSASFTFPTVPGGMPAYEVVVLPSSGKITSKTILIESPAMPPCGTRRLTETVTTTATVTTGTVVTSTDHVTISVPSYQTVTVGAVTGKTSVVTQTTTVFTSQIVFTTTTFTNTSTSTVTTSIAG